MATVSPPSTGADVPAGERGATRVADRVVAKIAARAAREALREAAPAPHRRPRDGDGGPPRRPPAVRRGPAADRRGAVLPAPIGAQCGLVRRHVTERVRELAGMTVAEVAVQVERLNSPLLTDRERVR
ncbi:hypothetical protein O1L44_26860 [Streptomyces noursei]|nr:hypothetical protein [Streptomyces noursei]